MKNHTASLLLIVVISVLLASCSFGPVSINFGPTATPTATLTPTATPTPVPTSTPTATPTPVTIPGIDTPITVRGVDMRFIKIDVMTEYQSVFGTSRANPPFTNLLLVEAKTSSPDPNAACKWEGTDRVSLAWTRAGDSGKVEWGMCISNSKQGFLQFLFAGYSDYDSLTLILPDGAKVPLESLMK